MIYLFADTGDTITLTNTSSPSADGHIKTISDANETLSTTKPTILIRKGNYWYGYGGGTTADGSVTNVKLADMAANTIKVRNANSSGAPSDIALADYSNPYWRWNRIYSSSTFWRCYNDQCRCS